MPVRNDVEVLNCRFITVCVVVFKLQISSSVQTKYTLGQRLIEPRSQSALNQVIFFSFFFSFKMKFHQFLHVQCDLYHLDVSNYNCGVGKVPFHEHLATHKIRHTMIWVCILSKQDCHPGNFESSLSNEGARPSVFELELPLSDICWKEKN